MFGPVSSRYFQHVEEGNLQEDAEQFQCLATLDQLYYELHRPALLRYFHKATLGAYIVGSVGRGKTYLMDLFFSTVKRNKQRWHYHIFLSHLHNNLMHHSSSPWEELAQSVYRHGRLLCLDEFQIMDMGDLMILSRFLKIFFRLGGILVTTSNRMPNEFKIHNQNYLEQFHHFLSKHVHTLRLDHGPDFRRKGYSSHDTLLHQKILFRLSLLKFIKVTSKPCLRALKGLPITLIFSIDIRRWSSPTFPRWTMTTRIALYALFN